jgi:hypothetical protein
MKFKRIYGLLLQSAALMACVNLAFAQAQAQSAQEAPAPQAASASGLLLVEHENAGRDVQGTMRIKVINGGIKLPAKP